MRGNKLTNERKQAMMVLTVFRGLVSVSIEEKGHLQGATHTEVRKEEKERSWCLPERRTSPTFFILCLQGKEK